jgi:hypothetical protein
MECTIRKRAQLVIEADDDITASDIAEDHWTDAVWLHADAEYDVVDCEPAQDENADF